MTFLAKILVGLIMAIPASAAIPSKVITVEAPEPDREVLVVATTTDIKAYIAQSALSYGISTHLAVDLAQIESRFNPFAKNPSSTAKGIYQFIDSSWESFCEGDAYNFEDNVSCAHRILQEPKGIRHWTVVTSTRSYFLEAGSIECSIFEKNLCEVI